jgi:hypothetical protein
MNDSKTLWKKACKFDKIPPRSKFVSFSKENPYVADYNKSVREEMQQLRKIR